MIARIVPGSSSAVSLIPEETDGAPEEETAEAAMFFEALVRLFAGELSACAVRLAASVQDVEISLRGCADRHRCFREGMEITVSARCGRRCLEELAACAGQACFPEGAAMCPCTYHIIARS